VRQHEVEVGAALGQHVPLHGGARPQRGVEPAERRCDGSGASHLPPVRTGRTTVVGRSTAAGRACDSAYAPAPRMESHVAEERTPTVADDAPDDTGSVERPVPGGDGVTESEVSPEELEEAAEEAAEDPDLQKHVDEQAGNGDEDGDEDGDDSGDADDEQAVEAPAAEDDSAEQDVEPQPDADPDDDEDEDEDESAQDERLPGHADHVVVPIANPDTAEDLLLLAAALSKVDGRVEALAVLLDDAQLESSGDGSEKLKEIVAKVGERNPLLDVELIARPAPSVARGILEQARETGADLLLLGVPPAGSSGSVLGRIAESVVDVAPCDVVMVRPGQNGVVAEDASRIVVTVDGSDTSRTAVRSGVLLGDGMHLPVEVVHVQELGRPRMEGLAVLAASLEGVEGRETCRTRLLRGPDPADAVIAATQPGDLTLIGLRRESDLRQWLFGSVSTDLLERSSSPVLVVARSVQQVGVAGRLDKLRRFVKPDLTDVEQENLVWQARRQAIATIDYLTLLMLSAILATLGLVQNSVAVIIGAMLVAPLLGPLSATSIGLVTARTPLLRKGLLTVAAGSLLAVAVSFGIGAMLPLQAPTSEMLFRGQPTLLDLGVAMASGLVGAFATARRDVPAALAGVAIAAALVPPISTIGLGIALGDASLATGATLLYLVNVSAVTATGAAAFWWLGLRPVEQDSATRRRVVSASMAVGLSVLVVSVLVLLLNRVQAEQLAERDLREELADSVGVEVTDVELDDQGDVLVVTGTLRSDEPITPGQVADAERTLEQDLERDVELRVVVLDVVTPQG